MFEMNPRLRTFLQGLLLLGGIGLFVWGWYHQPITIENPMRRVLMEMGTLSWTVTLYWVFSHLLGNILPEVDQSVRGVGLGLVASYVGDYIYEALVEILLSGSLGEFALIVNSFWRGITFQNKIVSLLYLLRWTPSFILLLLNTWRGDKN